jgi:hypothetical protein
VELKTQKLAPALHTTKAGSFNLFVIFWWFKAGLFFVFKKYFKKK